MVMRAWEQPNVNNAFFSVDLVPLYFTDKNGAQQRVNDVRGIYDCQRDSVISTVSSAYNLVSNYEAYKTAEKIVPKIFHNTKLEDLKFYNLRMPKTRTFMHLDLIKPNSDIEPFKDDKWTPFLRITNSYNRLFSLSYELGFCRWICQNGMIFNAHSVKLNFTHGGEIKTDFKNLSENLKDIHDIESGFCEKLNHLRNIPIPRDLMEPMFFEVFRLRNRKEYSKLSEIQLVMLAARKEYVKRLINNYVNEMECNAYAMLNILTDFASFPSDGRNESRHLSGAYQKKVGTWTNNFEEYLKNNKDGLKDFISQDAFDCAEYVMNAPAN